MKANLTRMEGELKAALNRVEAVLSTKIDALALRVKAT